ncbi:uncharacterized protein LOC134006908 [Osmerus eperlanus]|uniref:uncharacterized protein LOC134006908 n=1 Tax=Osmerus eperlanus TaxID=29151 RepID=UPI002E0FCB3A
MMWSANISLEVLFLMSWVCAELAKHNTVKSTFEAEVNRRLTRKGSVNDGHTSNNEASLDSKALENENKIYVPNWKYIIDSKATHEKGMQSHFNQPLYHCGHESISIRLHLIRLADFYFMKGTLPPLSLRMLPKECHHVEMERGPWLLIRLPYQGCYMTQWIDGAVQYHSMNLMYFDRLLMKNVTGNAICQIPTTSPTSEVSCGKKSMTVKLPAGTHRTMRVLGPQAQDEYNVSLLASSHALFVKFSQKVKTEYDGMSLQLVYQNFAGEMSTVKMSCSSRRPKSRRFTREVDETFLDFWEFQDIALKPYIPDETSKAQSYFENYDFQDMPEAPYVPTLAPQTTKRAQTAPTRPSLTKTFPTRSPAPNVLDDEFCGFQQLFAIPCVPATISLTKKPVPTTTSPMPLTKIPFATLDLYDFEYYGFEDMPTAPYVPTLAPRTTKPACTATLWPSLTNKVPTRSPTPLFRAHHHHSRAHYDNSGALHHYSRAHYDNSGALHHYSRAHYDNSGALHHYSRAHYDNSGALHHYHDDSGALHHHHHDDSGALHHHHHDDSGALHHHHHDDSGALHHHHHDDSGALHHHHHDDSGALHHHHHDDSGAHHHHHDSGANHHHHDDSGAHHHHHDSGANHHHHDDSGANCHHHDSKAHHYINMPCHATVYHNGSRRS